MNLIRGNIKAAFIWDGQFEINEENLWVLIDNKLNINQIHDAAAKCNSRIYQQK